VGCGATVARGEMAAHIAGALAQHLCALAKVGQPQSRAVRWGCLAAACARPSCPVVLATAGVRCRHARSDADGGRAAQGSRGSAQRERGPAQRADRASSHSAGACRRRGSSGQASCCGGVCECSRSKRSPRWRPFACLPARPATSAAAQRACGHSGSCSAAPTRDPHRPAGRRSRMRAHMCEGREGMRMHVPALTWGAVLLRPFASLLRCAG